MKKTIIFLISSLIVSLNVMAEEDDDGHIVKKSHQCVFSIKNEQFTKSCSGEDVLCGDLINSSCSVKVKEIHYVGVVKK